MPDAIGEGLGEEIMKNIPETVSEMLLGRGTRNNT